MVQFGCSLASLQEGKMNENEKSCLAIAEHFGFTAKEYDAAQHPILEVDGVRFFYRGRTSKGDQVWESEDESEQLVFIAPDFGQMENRIGLDKLVVVEQPAGRL